MMQNEFPLVRGIIDAFLFLETSRPDEVNPDSAVRCMESISASLLSLEHSDQLTLRSNLERIANDAQDHAYSDFIRKLPDMIGLASS
jgi:hypothetical protein